MGLSRTTRICIAIAFTTVFFLAEIIVGYWSNSLALITDSFHMLNDLLSYVIAIYAFKVASANKTSSKYSYGRQRAEVLGGFINGVLLLSLCLNIFIEAIQRFFTGQEIKNIMSVLYVGSAGLAANIIGLVLFHEHSHHGHSHSPSTTSAHEEDLQERDEAHQHEESHDYHNHKDHDHNMKGVFLHVLGDALGNIGVIASALFIRYTDFEWRYYADPVVSMLLTIIIFATTLPFVRNTSSVLLQGVPLGIPIDTVRDKIQKISGIISVHEFHVWQLSNAKHVASVHLRLLPSVDYMSLITNVKYILHTYGIHSTTIQPEFGDLNVSGTISQSNIKKHTWIR
ncbi:cation efflux protein [Gigaspora rosea]|uniref:Cation efflux protein n=1 Tax=Gigaspora rosea TaxID=44941 RepID=A0A397VNS1_9GLOM|nr:cation efflux protein [Gigaspora rosea]